MTSFNIREIGLGLFKEWGGGGSSGYFGGLSACLH